MTARGLCLRITMTMVTESVCNSPSAPFTTSSPNRCWSLRIGAITAFGTPRCALPCLDVWPDDPRAYAPQQIELLTGLGVDVGVISGTHAENIDGQLQARPSGPGYLYLCVNRGSLIYLADSTDIHLVHRMASAAEEVALDRAAERTAAALQQRGLTPLVQPLRPLVCLCLARLTYERSRPPSTTTSAPVM